MDLQRYSLVIQTLQTALLQAIDMLEYYQRIEQEVTGKKDPQILSNLGLLNQLVVATAKFETVDQTLS